MDGFLLNRTDGRDDGEDWAENYSELPGQANVSIILESTSLPMASDHGCTCTRTRRRS